MSQGDKVICIKSLPWRDGLGNVVAGPERDVVYLVSEVVTFRNKVGLVIAGWSGIWDATEFRRIVPKSERVESTEEMVA